MNDAPFARGHIRPVVRVEGIEGEGAGRKLALGRPFGLRRARADERDVQLVKAGIIPARAMSDSCCRRAIPKAIEL